MLSTIKSKKMFSLHLSQMYVYMLHLIVGIYRRVVHQNHFKFQIFQKLVWRVLRF